MLLLFISLEIGLLTTASAYYYSFVVLPGQKLVSLFLLTTQVILAICVKQRFVNPLAFLVAYFFSLYTSVGCLYARSSFLSPEVALVKEGDSVQSGMVLVFIKTIAYRESLIPVRPDSELLSKLQTQSLV